MIETLLPKAAYNKENKGKFKMIELWADKKPRKGWLKVYQK